MEARSLGILPLPQRRGVGPQDQFPQLTIFKINILGTEQAQALCILDERVQLPYLFHLWSWSKSNSNRSELADSLGINNAMAAVESIALTLYLFWSYFSWDPAASQMWCQIWVFCWEGFISASADFVILLANVYKQVPAKAADNKNTLKYMGSIWRICTGIISVSPVHPASQAFFQSSRRTEDSQGLCHLSSHSVILHRRDSWHET